MVREEKSLVKQMSNASYWEKRKAQRMFEYMEEAEKAAKEISQVYLKASRYLSLESEGIFEKYQTKHNLSEEEARRLLNRIHDKKSMEELKEALAAAKNSREKEELQAKLESPAYRARLEHLQRLQEQLDQTMRDVYRQEKEQSTNHYLDLGEEAYYQGVFEIQKQTGLAFSFARIDTDVISRIINSQWSGANYSGRIWRNTQFLAEELKEELLINLLTGRTERETAQMIAERFSVGASKARRLVRTESCYLTNQMEILSYEECGIETYIFVATLDLRTSEICRSLDGKRFKVSEQQPGKNCPPMHPWCRSTTICGISDEELAEMKRRARDPENGKTYTVPANMTYEEWYRKYVEKSIADDIINASDTKEVVEVHSVGRINKEIYKCVTKEIVTDEVIITDERIGHIKERHPNDYEQYYGYLRNIIENPDYIIEANKPNTALILKEIKESEEKQFKTVLRLTTSTDNPDFKNSIITFMKISEKEWSRLLRNKRILYKKE